MQHHPHLTPKIITASFHFLGPWQARAWFDRLPYPPNAVAWNVMFKGYTNAGFHLQTLELFGAMRQRDVRPNRYSFTLVLKSCAKLAGGLRMGEEVHCFAEKCGFVVANVFVGTGLIDVYSAGGVLSSARRVFDEMPVRNVVTSTAMITAYLLGDDLSAARKVFDQTGDRDVVVWNTMISGYLDKGKVGAARELFDSMRYRDLMCWNTMLQGYAYSTQLDACERFFDEMPERNVFSWNRLISGYIFHGRFLKALFAFRRMLGESSDKPDEATFVMVLLSCARLGALDLGRWIHMYAYGNGFRSSINIGNALIDMYSKCGSINSALEVFDGMERRDVVTWNTAISGLSLHGSGTEALSLFDQMKGEGQIPDGITFVGILCACSHMGLVQEGFTHFRSMVEKYKISPWIEHYGCMVDLLGRAGLLQEALHFVKTMPIEADHVIWTSLLAACQIYRDVDLAEVAIEKLSELEREDGGNYVALSNIYGLEGRWEDVAKAKHTMRARSEGKLPGCSLIEVNQEVTEFYSSDIRHSQVDEIYSTLETLAYLSKIFFDEET